MPARTRLLWVLVAVVALVAVDQATKLWAIETLKPEPAARTYLGNTVRIQYAENKGAFLSLLADASDRQRFLVLTLANGVILAVVGGVLLLRRLEPLSTVAFTCIFAGGLSNLIDRIRLDGIVIDFLNVGLGGFRTGIFNIADMAIMLGFFLLIAATWRNPDRPDDVSETAARDGETAAGATADRPATA